MTIPQDPHAESTLAQLSAGYGFISRRCRALGTDAFHTRLMLRPVTCAVGEEAARMFYAPGRFTRVGAMPPTTLRLLHDKGSVQTLDGPAHRARKQLFLSLMSPQSLLQMTALFEEQWRRQYARWARRDAIVLHDEMQQVLCKAVCDWAGVPLPDEEAPQRARELGAMIAGSGAVSGELLRGLWLRGRSERWARARLRELRRGRSEAPPGSGAASILAHRDVDGRPLSAQTAAVELINLLRPTVAVARYIAFAALALHEHPQWRSELQTADESALERFVQEVRRYYPFFALIGGRVREPFDWRGEHFERGHWFLLDLYGTLHDPRLWDAPEQFRPQRFVFRQPGLFDLIPQGGGEYESGHRCAGEWLTIALVKTALRRLLQMRYTLPSQDLSVSLSRLPALPASGVILRVAPADA